MFRIGEFSKLTQVSIRMLRYYDETGLLKPVHIDKFTGYRIYSVEQIPILHKIIFLRDTGFNVSEITVALCDWDKSITDHLKKKQQEIQSSIKLEQEKLAKIDIAMDDISDNKISIHCNVSLKSIPTYRVLSLRRIIPNYFCEGMLWQELFDYAKAHHVDMTSTGSDFAIYHDMDYKDSDVDVEVCVVVDQIGESSGNFRFREIEKVDTMVCSMVYGPFENIAPGYESFAHWLMQHDQYQMTGQNRQICHRGPWNEKDPNKYLTEIQIPVEKHFV